MFARVAIPLEAVFPVKLPKVQVQFARLALVSPLIARTVRVKVCEVLGTMSKAWLKLLEGIRYGSLKVWNPEAAAVSDWVVPTSAAGIVSCTVPTPFVVPETPARVT